MTGARRISIFCSHFMKVIVQITPFDKLPRHLDSMFFESVATSFGQHVL